MVQTLFSEGLLSGIRLSPVDLSIQAPLKEEARMAPGLVEFAFHFTGRGRAAFPRGGTRTEAVSVGPNRCLISYNPGVKCTIETEGRARFRALNIYLSPERLNGVLEPETGFLPDDLKALIAKGDSGHFNHADTLDPAMEMVIQQIYNCPHKGGLRKLYLETKVLELIVCRLARFQSRRRPLSLSRADVDRIHCARDLLFSRLADPPTLSELARNAGVNTTKLKTGFVRVFGAPPYTLLRRERACRARKALDQGEMNITQVAHHLGYSDASHFIREFVKYFGVTPGTYLKTGHPGF